MSVSIDQEFCERFPLLSRKPLCEFTPSEYKEYIRSLYWVKPKRAAVKKKLDPFKVRLNHKGTLIIKVNREPKWLTRTEIDHISTFTGKPVNEVWNKAVEKDITIYDTEEQARLIHREIVLE